jgi:ATP-dependent helicase/nuclease subunit A
MTNLTLEQQAAAYTPSSVVVTAGAGTGKTHMLAERYLYYLRERDLSPLEIVAVTFTEKAATELRSRIRFLVGQELPERVDILAELEAAQISTIHALSARICQEYYQFIDIPADFSVLDDLEGKVWLEDGLRAAITNLPQQVFGVIPYSLLSEILVRLLDDPFTADRALQQGIQDWKKLLADARLTALISLVNDRIWQDSWWILRQYQGQEGDKLESVRQYVIKAMEDIEGEENVTNGIEIINQINLRGGSQKKWRSQDEITIVKKALGDVRDLVREALKQGLINLEFTVADEQLKTILPAVTEAYFEVSNYLNRLKEQARVLTFSDLEIYALQALQSAEVREYYRQRWQVFLVDEFQDTNPTQAELLTLLTRDTELTIVGDIKQSIYGFRRADIRVFKQFRDRILQDQGQEVILSKSFRTHQQLVHSINQIFAPLLGENHQELVAHRQQEPMEDRENKFNYVRAISSENSNNINKGQRQQNEAKIIAQKIKQMLDNKTPVYDQKTQQLRSIQPQDIAILTRTWQPLGLYEQALRALNIPVAADGGGNLLATREAKDANALLRFLADPQDDIALVAVLRSPFFAISDRVLFLLTKEREKQESMNWWKLVKKAKFTELEHPINTLQKLLAKSQEETPSRLLQIAANLTGYSAVIANLSSGKRRLADWQGFYQLIKELERGTKDLFGVVRHLKRLYDREVAVPRPMLTVDNAVSLMTIFAAKGLEWSVVVVGDLSRQRPQNSPPVYFDSQLGVAVKSPDQTEETRKPVLYTWLEYQQKQREAAESLRVLYVALTRARDYLILSGTDAEKGDFAQLKPSLDAANIPIETIPLDFETREKKYQPQKETSPTLPTTLLLDSVGSGLSQLPVTALTEYARCPQRFQLHLIQGHPGIGEGMAAGMQVGTLVHKALEHNITTVQKLLPYGEIGWNEDVFSTALNMAQQFWQLPVYQPFRDHAIAKEQQISLQIGKIIFNGVIDLVGDNWVLDYKSDRDIAPQDHRFQLWVYARALQGDTPLQHQQAHIAYLRHDYVYSFNQSQLKAIAPEVEILSDRIYAGDYTPTPTMEKCAVCPYLAFCDFAIF